MEFFLVFLNFLDDSGVSAYMLFYRLCDDINEKMETPSIPEELMKIFREEEIEIKKREEVTQINFFK